MNIHNEINDDIKFLAKSEIRLKILSEIYNKPDNARGLFKKTKITYSSISSNLAKLEQNDHIKKINSKYHITPMSEIYFKTLMDFKNTVDLINEYDGFWDKHNLNQLSIDSLKNITDLKDSTLIETTPIDIYKTHNTIKEHLMEKSCRINVHLKKALFSYALFLFISIFSFFATYIEA